MIRRYFNCRTWSLGCLRMRPCLTSMVSRTIGAFSRHHAADQYIIAHKHAGNVVEGDIFITHQPRPGKLSMCACWKWWRDSACEIVYVFCVVYFKSSNVSSVLNLWVCDEYKIQKKNNIYNYFSSSTAIIRSWFANSRAKSEWFRDMFWARSPILSASRVIASATLLSLFSLMASILLTLAIRRTLAAETPPSKSFSPSTFNSSNCPACVRRFLSNKNKHKLKLFLFRSIMRTYSVRHHRRNPPLLRRSDRRVFDVLSLMTKNTQIKTVLI